jgi:quercetin dioxygenase-like cupin family protein
MKIIDLATIRCEAIEPFESLLASAAPLADGDGEAHAYVIRIEPGGSIGAHPTGFGQLFIVVEGEGWVAGPDGVRQSLKAGSAAHFSRGEMHSKGSDTGMTAIMLQVRELHRIEEGR